MDPGTSSRGGVRSEINVTPLVDVCLVLLIIFMVVIPILQMGYPVTTPPARPVDGPAPSDQLIVRLAADGRMFLNRQEVAAGELATRLQQATVDRGKKLVFFAAAGELPYGQVADFMDLVRSNGAETLGIAFDDLEPAGT